jgi:hypothetical protein
VKTGVKQVLRLWKKTEIRNRRILWNRFFILLIGLLPLKLLKYGNSSLYTLIKYFEMIQYKSVRTLESHLDVVRK